MAAAAKGREAKMAPLNDWLRNATPNAVVRTAEHIQRGTLDPDAVRAHYAHDADAERLVVFTVPARLNAASPRQPVEVFAFRFLNAPGRSLAGFVEIAECAKANRHLSGVRARVAGERPDEGDNPAERGPAEKQVEDDNRAGGHVAAHQRNDAGEEIDREDEEDSALDSIARVIHSGKR